MEKKTKTVTSEEKYDIQIQNAIDDIRYSHERIADLQTLSSIKFPTKEIIKFHELRIKMCSEVVDNYMTNGWVRSFTK